MVSLADTFVPTARTMWPNGEEGEGAGGGGGTSQPKGYYDFSHGLDSLTD